MSDNCQVCHWQDSSKWKFRRNRAPEYPSKNVRMFSELITKWVFEDFEIWTIRKNLFEIQQWTGQLEMYLEAVLVESENKASLLEKTAGILKTSKLLLEKYEGYYLTAEMTKIVKAWKHTQLDNPVMVHEVISQSVRELLKSRKP